MANDDQSEKPEGKRGHRRFDENKDDLTHVSGIDHSSIRTIITGKTKYEREMGGKTKEMVDQMVKKEEPKKIKKTQEEAIKIYRDASEEASDIDRQLLQSMIDKPTAQATANIEPQIVNLAMNNAVSNYLKEGGILDEQKERADALKPRDYAAPRVREEAELILKNTKNAVETFGFNASEHIDDEERYENVPPLSDPVEVKNISLLLPNDPALIEDDLRQLHIHMLINLPPRDKPDAISLAQAYLKYRRSLIAQNRSII